jgi:hypothetical protein
LAVVHQERKHRGQFEVSESEILRPSRAMSRQKSLIRRVRTKKKCNADLDLNTLALGVKCVIAKSFSYIYGRSQPNLGIVGIVLTDQEFHNLAIDSAEVEVNLGRRLVSVAGKSFPFVMDDMEIRLIENKGLSEAYRRFGKSMFKTLTEGEQDAPLEAETVGNELAW